MSNNITTNQHFVPQSYLRRFASSKEQVCVFDKSKQSQFVTSVRNVASERYFYDLPVDEVAKDADFQVLEKMFQKVENHFSKAVEKVAASVETGQRMEMKQKQALAYFLHVQQARTRKSRNRQMELLGKMMTSLGEKQLKLKGFDLEELGVSVTMDEKAVLGLQGGMIFNYKEALHFVETLLNHACFIGVNQTSTPLWTSDDPVVMQAHERHPVMSMAGTASRGIEIAFPLTPALILILFERTFHQDLSNHLYEHIMLNEEDITYYNGMQAEQSHRQIYSSNDNFALALNLCKQHPELCDPERAGVEMNDLNIDGKDIIHSKNVDLRLRRVRRFQDIGRR